MKQTYITCDCCGKVIENYDYSFIKFKKRKNVFYRYTRAFSRNDYYPHEDLDICEGCWHNIIEEVKKLKEEK